MVTGPCFSVPDSLYLRTLPGSRSQRLQKQSGRKVPCFSSPSSIMGLYHKAMSRACWSPSPLKVNRHSTWSNQSLLILTLPPVVPVTKSSILDSSQLPEQDRHSWLKTSACQPCPVLEGFTATSQALLIHLLQISYVAVMSPPADGTGSSHET